MISVQSPINRMSSDFDRRNACLKKFILTIGIMNVAGHSIYSIFFISLLVDPDYLLEISSTNFSIESNQSYALSTNESTANNWISRTFRKTDMAIYALERLRTGEIPLVLTISIGLVLISTMMVIGIAKNIPQLALPFTIVQTLDFVTFTILGVFFRFGNLPNTKYFIHVFPELPFRTFILFGDGHFSIALFMVGTIIEMGAKMFACSFSTMFLQYCPWHRKVTDCSMNDQTRNRGNTNVRLRRTAIALGTLNMIIYLVYICFFVFTIARPTVLIDARSPNVSERRPGCRSWTSSPDKIRECPDETLGEYVWSAFRKTDLVIFTLERYAAGEIFVVFAIVMVEFVTAAAMVFGAATGRRRFVLPFVCLQIVDVILHIFTILILNAVLPNTKYFVLIFPDNPFRYYFHTGKANAFSIGFVPLFLLLAKLYFLYPTFRFYSQSFEQLKMNRRVWSLAAERNQFFRRTTMGTNM